MPDISSLQIKVDSRDVKKGKLTLVDFSKQAEKTEKKTDKAFDKMGKSFKDMSKSFDKSSGVIEKDFQKIDKSAQKTSKTMSGLKKTVLGLTAAFGVYKAASFSKEAALAAARYETLGVVLDTVGRNAGISAGELEKTTKALESSGISMASARQGAIKLIQSHIDLSKATKLSRIAQDAAVIGNINSSEAFERLIYGVQTAQIEVLKSIGITVNFETAYKKLAATLGISASKLTETQKTQARLNVVMERGEDIAGAYESAIETSSKKINSFTRYVDNFKVTMGKAFGPATSMLIDSATESMKDLTETFSDPEAQEGMKEFASGLASIGSALMDLGKASATIVKYAGLRSVSETFSQAQDLVRIGLIDRQEFLSAGFMQRQKMVDEAIKKSTIDLWRSKADFEKKYKASVERQVKAEENAAKRIKKLREEQAQQNATLAEKENKDIAEQLKEQREQREKLLSDAQIEYFKMTQGQLAYEKNLVLNQKELWIKAGYDRVKATEWANNKIKKLNDEAAAKKKKQEIETANFTEEVFTSVFTDVLRADLDSFENYFNNFTNSLASMWVDMAAKMVFTNAALPSGMTMGGFAGAGAAIAGSSALMNALNSRFEDQTESIEKLTAEYVQERQLTGTLLGDANTKSDSANNALENILEVNMAGLDISKDMLTALTYISTNNDRIAASIGRGAGSLTSPQFQSVNEGITTSFMDDIIDAQVKFWFKGLDQVLGTKLGASIGRLFGSTKQSLIDQGIQVYSQNMTDIMERSFSGATFQTIQTTKRRLFSRSSSTRTSFGTLSGDISGGLAGMFTGVSEALLYGADTFGIAMEGMYDHLTIAEQQISLKGKTAEEAAEIIGNFVSMTADKWSETILTGTGLLENYQQAGEGAFETYVRLTNETEYFTSSLEAMGLAINATGTDLVNIAQSTIEASGGIEALQASMGSFYNAFYTDAEKQQNIYSGLKDAFSEMNMILPSTRQGFRNIVEGLDLTNEADQERFSALMAMSETADQYYGYLEKTFESVSKSFEAARKSLISEVVGANQTYAMTQQSLFNALNAARKGDFSQAVSISGNLSGLTTGATNAKTELEYKRDRLRTAAALQELEELTSTQLTTDELMVSELETANQSLSNIEAALTGEEVAGVTEPIITNSGDSIQVTAASMAQVLNAIKELQTIISSPLPGAALYEITKASKKSYDIVDKWDNDGLPAERTA